MSLALYDRVRETTGVLGTSDAVLLGAVIGYQSFAVVGNTNTCYYTIADSAGNWEVGLGTYSTTGPTLARTTVYASSNANAKVSFPAGTKDIFLTYPAEKAVALDTASAIATGSMLYGNGTTSYSSLALGTNGYILQSNGTAPTWVAASTIIGGAGGSNTQVQYNNSGALAGSANMTFDGTSLTLANDATIHGLTVGLGGSANSLNTVVGNNGALSANTSGYGNSAFGSYALASNTIGYKNNSVGAAALYKNVSGNNNSSFGDSCLYNNVAGSGNTGVGSGALFTNNANNNTAIGFNSGYYTSTGTPNTSVGYGSLYTNSSGTNNAAFGDSSLASSTGSYNTAIGSQTLFSNTTASYNTAVGYQAGFSNTTGVQNTLIGQQAGYGLTVGNTNTFIGALSGYSINNASDSRNTFVGCKSGYSVTTGTNNTFIGGTTTIGSNGAGYNVTTGSNNTILGCFDGNQGGLDIRTASNYIVLSDGAGNPRGFWDNNGIFWTGTGGVQTGDSWGFLVGVSSASAFLHPTGSPSSTSYCNFNYAATPIGSVTQNGTTGVLYNTSSDYRLKENPEPLTGAKDFILALQPKTWTWAQDGSKGTGFIAHEAQQVATQSVTGEKDAVDEDGKPVYQSMQAGSPEIIANLVALAQEQQALIESLTTRIAALEAK